MLSAAITACFREANGLHDAAQLAIAISFRIGALAARAGGAVSHIKGSWRVGIETDNNSAVAEAVTGFNLRKVWSKETLINAEAVTDQVIQGLRAHNALRICGVAPTCVFVAGFPALLDTFRTESNLPTEKLQIAPPFHYDDLFSFKDVEAIINELPSTFLDREALFQSFLPDSRDDTSEPIMLRTILHEVIVTILKKPIAGELILKSLRSTVEDKTNNATIVAIGTENDAVLENALKAAKNFVATSAVLQECIAKPIESRKIAITGYSGRFPQADTLEKFWEVLHQGIDTHATVPADRWDVKTHVDQTGQRKNTSATPFGCWLDNPGLFDRSFFSISPREAPQMDPAQRIALMCAYEALEMSGIVADATPSTRKSRVGVFIGCTSNDWCETNSAQNVDAYFIPGGNRAFIPGRINYFFKFSGPSYAIDTACSSSLAAIHLACNSLWKKEIDTAIVGGTNIITNPDVTAGLDRGHFLSRTGNRKSFDDEADGYCRGEGVGILVLKRLKDAQAENDTIHACILSAATNHSAEAESITRPHVGAQQALFSQVFSSAGVRATDVSYVEMHGTGTQAGDSREMQSVSETFAPALTGNTLARSSKLYVGSVKANVGHGEAVSGVTAIIKILLMMKKNEIVPHCGIKGRINHSFSPDLESRGLMITREAIPWLRDSMPRRAMVNNFSAAGGNTSILLEDAPSRLMLTDNAAYDNRPYHIVTVSARTATALAGNVASIRDYLQNLHSVSLSDISYTSTARRIHYNFRTSFVAQTISDMRTLLAKEAAAPSIQFRGPPKMIFAFSGQGSNRLGMARTLYNQVSIFKQEMDRLDRMVQAQGFGTILDYLCDSSEAIRDHSLATAHLAHVCLQMGLSHLWIQLGVTPLAVIGHSLGEYAALNLSGVLSDYDAIWLCGQRARLLSEHCRPNTHGMLVARGAAPDVLEALKDVDMEIACLNGSQETVLSGALPEVIHAEATLGNSGFKTTRVNVPFAFHSSQVQPILAEFKTLVDQVELGVARIPIISPLLTTVIPVGTEIGKAYLPRQRREPVNLVGGMAAATNAGYFDDRTHVVEIGPGLILGRLIKRQMPDGSPNAIIPSLDASQDPSVVMAQSVAKAYRIGCNIDWSAYHRDYRHSVVTLPSYNWDLQKYWMQYVHDWSLRKGEPSLVMNQASIHISTTSCQQVTSVRSDVSDFTEVLVLPSDTSQGTTVKLDLQTNLLDDQLKSIVSGHRVNGVLVCIGVSTER